MLDSAEAKRTSQDHEDTSRQVDETAEKSVSRRATADNAHASHAPRKCYVHSQDVREVHLDVFYSFCEMGLSMADMRLDELLQELQRDSMATELIEIVSSNALSKVATATVRATLAGFTRC